MFSNKDSPFTHSGSSKSRLLTEKHLTSKRLGDATTRRIFGFSIGIEHPDLSVSYFRGCLLKSSD